MGLAAAAAVIGAGAPAAAAVIEQDVGPLNVAGGQGLGQSFVWSTSAPLGVVTVQSTTLMNVTLRLYNGVHTCDNSGGEIYTQTANPLSANVYSSIILTTPQALVNGNTYTFCVFREGGGTTALAYSWTTNAYAGGTLIADGLIDMFSNGSDLKFQLDVPPPAPVPTLTEWAMILFGVSLAGLAALFIRRRQVA